MYIYHIYIHVHVFVLVRLFTLERKRKSLDTYYQHPFEVYPTYVILYTAVILPGGSRYPIFKDPRPILH